MPQHISEQPGEPWQIIMDDRPAWQVVLETIHQYVPAVVFDAPRKSRGAYSLLAVCEQLDEIARFFKTTVLRFSGNPEWCAWGVRFSHRGFTVTARFHPQHPYEAPLITLDPAPVNRHYYLHRGEQAPRLCWAAPGDWQPGFRLTVAVASAIRFINDYLNGEAR